ncbi:MAG: histidine phosphatase family protein [Chloroflexia bacterium]|nr:histidine phosphatase family protein [Chloroflexia bacterium]
MNAQSDLWLVRHGHAAHHESQQLQWPEVPLTEQGHQQARRLAHRLAQLPDVAALYSSPLPRARETARPIGQALQLPPILQNDLREIDFGLAGGLSRDEFRQRWPEGIEQWSDPLDLDFRWPGGESRHEFQGRAVRILSQLVQAHPGQRLIVVSHTGILCCYLAHLLLGSASRWRETLLRPASVSRLQVGPAGVQSMFLDDLSHLQHSEENV